MGCVCFLFLFFLSYIMFLYVTYLLLFRRSLVCHPETARPQDCCWLQEWGGDRHQSTSSHRGIQMSPLQSNIETTSPPVRDHTHTHTCIRTDRHIHLMRVYADVSFTSSACLHMANVCIHADHTLAHTFMYVLHGSGQIRYHPMLMRHRGCLALHKIHLLSQHAYFTYTVMHNAHP